MTLMLVFTAISNAAAAQKFLILMCLPATKKGLTDFQLRTEMFITVAYVQAVIIKIINFKGETIMAKKYYCPVCGYESDEPIEICPICKAKMAVREDNAEMSWAAEHVVGITDGVREEIVQGLRDNFNGECSEVGMYLAMARVAHREGYPEIGLYWEKAAYEEAEHAAKFAEMLGEVVTDSTKKNLEMRVAAENGATLGKFELAKMAKEDGLDAIHDTVHEMARDEARHGKAFKGLLERYFG